MSKSRKRELGRARLHNDLLERRVLQVTNGARAALVWWNGTNENIQAISGEMIESLKTITRNKLGFWEWLGYSPFRVLRFFGRMFDPARETEKKLAIWEHQFLKWRAEIMLGGDTEYSMADAANALGVPIEKARALIVEIREDRKRKAEEEKKKEEVKSGTTQTPLSPAPPVVNVSRVPAAPSVGGTSPQQPEPIPIIAQEKAIGTAS